ncbi:MAG TPA: hypothetical protein VFO58_07655 [Vicinamibacterales bacterium]|nr:hypothetical protein [Vicinamibacterales bacterium]
MEPTLASFLQGLEEATEFAKAYRFEMTDDYRSLIEQVEALPRNQSGADKSGRWLGGCRRWNAAAGHRVASRP